MRVHKVSFVGTSAPIPVPGRDQSRDSIDVMHPPTTLPAIRTPLDPWDALIPATDPLTIAASRPENLKKLGYDVRKHTSRGGGLRYRHSFLVASSGKDTYIIDSAFRDQFEISNALPGLRHWLDRIPAIVVARADRLGHLVSFLASKVAADFAERQVPLPPWRQPNNMRARWESQN